MRVVLGVPEAERHGFRVGLALTLRVGSKVEVVRRHHAVRGKRARIRYDIDVDLLFAVRASQ